MILKKKVIKLCGINDLVCEFNEVTQVVRIYGFRGVPSFFLIELNSATCFF